MLRLLERDQPHRGGGGTHALKIPTSPLEKPTPPPPPVRIKGGVGGLRIMVDPADPAAAEDSLRHRLQSRTGGFLRGASVVLQIDGPAVEEALLGRLLPALAEHDITVTVVETTRTPGGAGARRDARAAEARASRPKGAAMIVTGTVRAGQVLDHGGSIVVVGDVNPGAEIRAGGSVIVWGRLRGLVEAGRVGDPSQAVVCALDLAPTQLRIGRALARAPEDTGRRPEPEIARAAEEAILVAAWR